MKCCSDIQVDLKWLFWYWDTWSCTFLLPFCTSTAAYVAQSWEDLFWWRNFLKADAKIEVFWSPWWPSTAAALIRITAYEGWFENWGLERTSYIPLCWALASAFLVKTDKVPMCSYSESTTATSASVKDLLPHYRDRSVFPARKRLVRGMNPYTSNAATK